MGKLVEEKYICSLSCIKRSTSAGFDKNNYWVGSGLCLESNRPDPRLHSNHRLSGRSVAVAFRDLAGYPANTAASVEGVSGLGSEANIDYASQSSGCNCDYHHMGVGNSCLYVLVMAICRWCKKHLTIASKSYAITHLDAQNARPLCKLLCSVKHPV